MDLIVGSICHGANEAAWPSLFLKSKLQKPPPDAWDSPLLHDLLRCGCFWYGWLWRTCSVLHALQSTSVHLLCDPSWPLWRWNVCPVLLLPCKVSQIFLLARESKCLQMPYLLIIGWSMLFPFSLRGFRCCPFSPRLTLMLYPPKAHLLYRFHNRKCSQRHRGKGRRLFQHGR